MTFLVDCWEASIYVQFQPFNERPVQVNAADVERAIEVIAEVRKDFGLVSPNLAGSSKLRIILKAVLFARFVPGGRRRSSRKESG